MAIPSLLCVPPGVGKTCLVHLICHGQVLHNAPSTTGCSVEVKLHDYSGKDYFLEFWDIGGSPNYVNGRAVFYNQIHGTICAHTMVGWSPRQRYTSVQVCAYVHILDWRKIHRTSFS